ncbi:MAG: GTP cyclohydrolase FolE2 [Spirochaetaceae bacterium]|jgi:GTP cyclohydrolase I|nr:GTP cyclohydrolase FolE2 [Spirochaetaceae bacterium]
MIDIQSQSDTRAIALLKVGVKGLEYPIRVLDKMKKIQYTTAHVDLYANVLPCFKGTHMSRFIEVFHQYREDISMHRFLDMLRQVRSSLEAESAFGQVSFPFFIEKAAPVSGLMGMMSYQCHYQGRVDSSGRQFTVTISVPLTTVCPCSKAISSRGAHNQRGMVTVNLELGPFFWIEDIIALVEDCASSPVYALLKREDEKYVTEQAYDNPKFVEDLVRDVYTSIRALQQFPSFSVEAETYESIHNHNAFAYTEYHRG